MKRRIIMSSDASKTTKNSNGVSLNGKTKTLLTTGALVATLSIGIGAIAMSSDSYAEGDSVVDEINITVPTSCTMNATGMNSHNANIANGTYDSNIGKTDIKAFCNDNGGFSIYAIGFTNNEYGKNVLTNETLGTANDIITGTNISGDTSNWAMKLTKLTTPTPTYPIIIAGSTEDTLKQTNDPDFSNFTNIPNTYTKVAYRTTGTDINPEGQTTAEGTTLSTVYQAYISPTQPAGTYTGQVKYTLVHPYTEEPMQPQTTQAGKICYYANASDAAGTMRCQDTREIDWSSCNSTDYDSYCHDNHWNDIDIDTLPRLDSYKTNQTLFASNFSRNGYGFAGWSDSFDYATNPNAKFYGPQETVTFSEDAVTNGLSLYAVWIKSQGSIQDQSKVASVCNSLTTAPTDGTANLTSVSALTDQRDNNTYAIAKLADGKCWMIENLRLESTAEHNGDGTLAQGYGTSTTYGNFGGLADPESTGFTGTYSANSLYSNDGSNNTINIGTSNYPDYRMPRYNNLNTSARGTNTTTSQNIYSYGNYYTWHAAIADLTYNGTDNQSTTGTSLCPTGWHLPTGGNASAAGATTGVNVTGDTSTFREFYNLGYIIMGSDKTAYEDIPNYGNAYYSSNTTNPDGKTGATAFRSFPNNFLYSGDFYTSSARHRGSYGNYWSSTACNSYYSYILFLTSSLVYPGTNDNSNYLGRSIRCVAGS